jgi:hypothetical protein
MNGRRRAWNWPLRAFVVAPFLDRMSGREFLPRSFSQEDIMTRLSRGTTLAVLAVLALAGCRRDASQNYQANVAGPPDMASDTGMNASSTVDMNTSSTADMTNAGNASDVMNSPGNTTND